MHGMPSSRQLVFQRTAWLDSLPMREGLNSLELLKARRQQPRGSPSCRMPILYAFKQPFVKDGLTKLTLYVSNVEDGIMKFERLPLQGVDSVEGRGELILLHLTNAKSAIKVICFKKQGHLWLPSSVILTGQILQSACALQRLGRRPNACQTKTSVCYSTVPKRSCWASNQIPQYHGHSLYLKSKASLLVVCGAYDCSKTFLKTPPGSGRRLRPVSRNSCMVGNPSSFSSQYTSVFHIPNV